jgi:hypothetical protein
MPILIIIVLLIVLILVSLSSSADSYATAQMAQAQIETARAAQISASGNVLAMMILGGLIVLIVLGLLLIGFLWIRARARQAEEAADRPGPGRVRVPAETPGLMDPGQLNMLIGLAILERLQGGRPELAAPAEKDQAPDEPLSWLR